jgi:hypothetical protein
MLETKIWVKWTNTHTNKELIELFSRHDTFEELLKEMGYSNGGRPRTIKKFYLYLEKTININLKLWRRKLWYKWVFTKTNKQIENIWKKYNHHISIWYHIGYRKPSANLKDFDDFYNYCSKKLNMKLDWWIERRNFIGRNRSIWSIFVEENTKKDIYELWENNTSFYKVLHAMNYKTGKGNHLITNKFYMYCVKYLNMELDWWNVRWERLRVEQVKEAAREAKIVNSYNYNELMAIFQNRHPNFENKRVHGIWVKNKIIEMGLMKNECCWCKRKHESLFLDVNGNKIYNDKGENVIIKTTTDHINGNSHDNLLIFDKKGNIKKTNIRLLCNICHANTDTYCGGSESNNKYTWREETTIIDGEEVKYRESYIEE